MGGRAKARELQAALKEKGKAPRTAFAAQRENQQRHCRICGRQHIKAVGNQFIFARLLMPGAFLGHGRGPLEFNSAAARRAPEKREVILSFFRRQSILYGSMAIARARLMAMVTWRWCLAQLPETRRGIILPRSAVMNFFNRVTSL
jgi:hypothetical protein